MSLRMGNPHPLREQRQVSEQREVLVWQLLGPWALAVPFPVVCEDEGFSRTIWRWGWYFGILMPFCPSPAPPQTWGVWTLMLRCCAITACVFSRCAQATPLSPGGGDYAGPGTPTPPPPPQGASGQQLVGGGSWRPEPRGRPPPPGPCQNNRRRCFCRLQCFGCCSLGPAKRKPRRYF